MPDSARDHLRLINGEVRAELARVRTRRMIVDGIDAETGHVRLADPPDSETGEAGEVWAELAPSIASGPIGAGDDVLVGMLPAVGDRRARGSRFVLGSLNPSTVAGVVASTIANTAALTAFVSPTRIFAPGYLAVTGRTLRAFGRGRWSVTGSPALTIRVRLVNGATAVDLAVFTLAPSSPTNRPFRFDVTAQVIDPTHMACSGLCVYDNGSANVIALSDSALLAVDTSAALTARVTGQWSAADPLNTATLGNGLIEVLA